MKYFQEIFLKYEIFQVSERSYHKNRIHLYAYLHFLKMLLPEVRIIFPQSPAFSSDSLPLLRRVIKVINLSATYNFIIYPFEKFTFKEKINFKLQVWTGKDWRGQG